MIIIHLIERERWDSSQDKSFLFTDSLDQYSFIHCCLEQQILAVLSQWFSDWEEVIAVEIDTEKLIYPVKFENLEGGSEKFPHIYGPVNADAIVKWYPLLKIKGDKKWQVG